MRCTPPALAWSLAAAIASLAGAIWPAPAAAQAASAAADSNVPAARTWPLRARVVASGLKLAYGIRQVGRFHSGGPFVSNPEFLLQTQAGRALDPQRVLVAVGQNFGAVPGNPAHALGAIVSIDAHAATDRHALVVPAVLDAGRPAEGGAVQLYSVQSRGQLNRLHSAGARTADFAGVSGPRYLSINNGFGRPWVANAPFGLRGAGSESVLDPDGAPLANAPSDAAGGVFAGGLSARTSSPKAVRSGWFASLLNRQDSDQLTPGSLEKGALGTAFLGSSPDGSGFAVFAVVTGNGAVAQVHVQDGVDGLAPPGTIDVGGDDPGVIGIAFQWLPDRALYIADARRDRIAVLQLADDTRHFKVQRTRYLQSPWLKRPVDVAPSVPEIANPRFSSHTTLAGGSDLYVVNRGDGSVLRLKQDGTVVARAAITWPDGQAVGGDRLRSIAVSADAQRLWLIAERRTAGTGADSVLIEVSGFDANGAFAAPAEAAAVQTKPSETATEGARLFSTAFAPSTGLGARFNAVSCVACHPGPGGASSREEHFARRIGRMDLVTGRVQASDDRSASMAPRHSMVASTVLSEPLPRSTNVVSLRMPPALAAIGRLDEIPDAVIEAQAVSKGDGIKGRAHYVTSADGTQRVGRYGWKADSARLEEIVAEALGKEMGITSALAAHPAATVTDDGTLVRALSAYLRELSTSSARALPKPVARRRTEEALQ
ncbi:di-heme oxidoredictase family protein [Roseateles sp.]|uniref:di-heme oxidoredictase family protein n=1 Tax=Roseateles sp. TaxID=1971397 RepID=UPI0032663821